MLTRFTFACCWHRCTKNWVPSQRRTKPDGRRIFDHLPGRSCVAPAIVPASKKRRLRSKSGWTARIPMKEIRKLRFLSLHSIPNYQFRISNQTEYQTNTFAQYSNGEVRRNSFLASREYCASQRHVNKVNAPTCWRRWLAAQRIQRKSNVCWTSRFWSKMVISPKMIFS